MLPLLPVLAGAAPLDDVIDLIPGYSSACALQSDGDLYCWGAGFGARATRVAEQVAAVADPSCRLGRNGTATCWGRDPIRGFPPSRQLVRWGKALCALGDDGRVWCAGDWALAAGGPRDVDPAVPAAIPDLDHVVELGGDWCVRRDDGGVWCLSPSGPRRVEAIPPAARLVGACVVGTDRTVWCWGDPTRPERHASGIDQLYADERGDRRCVRTGPELRCWAGRAGPRSWDLAAAHPVQRGVPGVPDGEVALGTEIACGIDPGDGGRVRCWGDGSRGAWGDGTLAPWPTRVGSGLDRGFPSWCQARSGRIECREGDSPFDSPTAPRALTALRGVDEVEMGTNSCALADGTLYCFGPAWRGSREPEPGVALVAEGVVSFGLDHSPPYEPGPGAVFYVRTDGSVHRREHGGTADRVPIDDADQVAVASGSACARRRDGTAWCWDPATWEWLDEQPPGAEPDERPTLVVRRMDVEEPVEQLRAENGSDGGVCALPAYRCTVPAYEPQPEDGAYHLVEVSP